MTGSFTTVDQSGSKYQATTTEFNAEFEPVGGVIPQTDPASDPAVAAMQYRTGGNVFEPEIGCVINGFEYGWGPCTQLFKSWGAITLGGYLIQRTVTTGNVVPGVEGGGYESSSSVELVQLPSKTSVIITPLQKSKPKGLPDCIKSYLVERWRMNKDAVFLATFSRSNPPALNFTVSGSVLGANLTGLTYTYEVDVDAFTWGYNIDFKESAFNPADGIDGNEVALAGHEVRHVEQHRKDGAFTAKYLANYVANLGDEILF